MLRPLLARVPHHKLGTRIVAASLLALGFALCMVLGTLWLSWALEGAAAAINDTGSLRMRSVRMGLVLQQSPVDTALLRQQRAEFDATVAQLRTGDAQRPLRLPTSSAVRRQFEQVTASWQQYLAPALDQALGTATSTPAPAQRYLLALPSFVDEANRLVALIEAENARDTAWLRASQMALAALFIGGTVVMVFLLYGWVIRPVEALRRGIGQMTEHDFAARVPVESQDEFGELAEGFNTMAGRLQASYATLEQRVQDKTALLAAQNRDLSTLYDFAAYLSQPGDMEARCQGFLERLMARFNAEGGSVRIRDPQSEHLHMVVHAGLSQELVDAEHCLHVNDCLCGPASKSGVAIVHDFRRVPVGPSPRGTPRCEQEGFASIAIFHIVNAGQRLGSFTLHFRESRALSAAERQLLDALGQHLGVAIENQRLLARTRELAVAEERTLVAQGLHDSIAQGLNFMNLQVQLLEDSLKRQAQTEVREVVGLLKEGIKESYEDVRELLSNFRMKLQGGDLTDALRMIGEKFTRQTGVPVQLDATGDGAPLPPEQQLQVLFIVQEALSNIRKHAAASAVTVSLHNQRDFALQVHDNGRGFEPAQVHGEQHVGLAIMRERASRLNAALQVHSQPGQGTHITLTVPAQDRIAA